MRILRPDDREKIGCRLGNCWRPGHPWLGMLPARQNFRRSVWNAAGSVSLGLACRDSCFYGLFRGIPGLSPRIRPEGGLSSPASGERGHPDSRITGTIVLHGIFSRHPAAHAFGLHLDGDNGSVGSDCQNDPSTLEGIGRCGRGAGVADGVRFNPLVFIAGGLWTSAGSSR